MIIVRTVIYPKLGTCTKRCHNHIGFAVMVEIAERRTSMAPRWLCSETGLFRQCRKFPSDISEHRVWLVDLYAVSHIGRRHVSLADESFRPSLSKSAMIGL